MSSAATKPTILSLAPSAASSGLVATECRSAWRTFVERSQDWGKADLVHWIYGMLVPMTRLAVDARTPIDDFSHVDVRFVDRLLRTARARVEDTLFSLESAETRVDFAWSMLASGAVVPCADARGTAGFVPAATSGPLADRVLALVAADLLAAPEAFETEVLCASCGCLRVRERPCCAASELRFAEPSTLRRPQRA